MRRPLHSILFILCAALASLACEEVLPPRVDPDVVLVPDMALSGNVVHVERGEVKSGGTIAISMRNVYDEVLSEEALVRANLAVSLRESPDSIHLFTYGPTDLVTQGLIVGNTLTLRVQQVAQLVRPWDHRTAAGTPFWEFGIRFSERMTSKGVTYYESDSLHLVVSATLQLFKRVQAARLPTKEFTIVYQLWSMPPPPLPDRFE